MVQVHSRIFDDLGRNNILHSRESLLLDTDNNFLLESKGTLHTFIIREVKKENFGTFSCSASNTFGKQTAHVLVTGNPFER